MLAPVAADPNLGRLGGRITDAITGKELWQVADDMPLVPASTNKVLTAAAALLTLDRQARISTRVVAGSQNAQGPVVLVGARGSDAVGGAARRGHLVPRVRPRISDLVEQVRRSGVTPTAVQVDTSAFSGPTMAPGWDPADVDNGDIAPIESVMIDAGRIQPTTVNSRRSRTPALDAGRELAKALGLDPAAVTVAAAPSGARQLAVGAVGAAGPAAVRDDGPLRQRDGRMHRPRGGGRDQPAAELRRRGRRGDQPAEHRAHRHRRVPRCWIPAGFRSTTG